MTQVNQPPQPSKFTILVSALIRGMLETITEETAVALGHGIGNLIRRIILLCNASVIPKGWKLDFNGIAACMNLTQDGARTMMDRNNVPYTKPGESRMFDAAIITDKYPDPEPPEPVKEPSEPATEAAEKEAGKKPKRKS